MIWDREDVLNTGTEYKFKTAPIDPIDPFRRNYITISYDENITTVASEQDWKSGDSIYVSLIADNNGFAKIKSISRIKPAHNKDFIKAKVSFVTENGLLIIGYPFDRYYMEESKAYDAELTYIQFQRDTNKITSALVCIKKGEAVLKDVMIDGISIREKVKSNQKKIKKKVY